MKVLLLEDNPREVRLLPELLVSNYSNPIQLESTGLLAEAMQCLDESDFDVVLMDLGLPDSDGMDTLKCLSNAHPTMPVVVLTGRDDERLALEALRLEAEDYVLKTEMQGGILARALRYGVERNRRLLAEERLGHVQEEERRRVARGLHDGVLQSLCALRLQLNILAERSDNRNGELSTQLRALADQALMAIDETRRNARDLYPVVLEKKRLGEAISSYAGQLQSESDMEFDIEVNCPRALPPVIKQHLFRISQECA